MMESTIVLLGCLAVIALMAVLIYVSSRGRNSAALSLSEMRRTLDQILTGNRDIERTLEKHRRVLYDAHKKIHEAVTKGLEKPAR
jgi:hypothetical protein